MKIIFFDIDGTLIGNGTKWMSKSTKEAIRLARANGHICMINTGRTKRLVGEEVTGQVEFDGLLLGCGTEIVYHGETLFHQTLCPELSKRILAALKKYKIDAILEGSREDYSPRPEEIHTAEFRRFAKGYEDRHYDTFDHAEGNFDKLYAYVEDKAVMDAFRKEFPEELEFIDREHGYFEVIPKGYSKATGIKYITDYLHIPMEDTVAIGDSSNDLSMLQYAHTSIAMGNSTQVVLDMADYITTDVSEDGIWNALQWLGVLKK